MILNVIPPAGALFASILFPKEELEHFSLKGTPNLALFYKKKIVLFSPAILRLWPGADFDVSLDSFRSFTQDRIVPAERLYLSDFWKKVERGPEVASGIFFIKIAAASSAVMMGLNLLPFSWGWFLALVSGDNRQGLRQILDEMTTYHSRSLVRVLDLWIRDSETEILVSHLLQRVPEEFQKKAVFSRKMIVPDLSGKKLYELNYRYSPRENWVREVLTERIDPAVRSEEMNMSNVRMREDFVSHSFKVERHAGIRRGGEIAIAFTVFVGGVSPLGTMSVPLDCLRGEAFTRFQRFLSDISQSLIPLVKTLTSDQFSYCRYGDEGGFPIEKLEEISRLIDPEHWETLVVIPFWMKSEGSPKVLESIRQTVRFSDPLFFSKNRDMGCILLRNTEEEKARTIVFPKFCILPFLVAEDPVTVKEFIINH